MPLPRRCLRRVAECSPLGATPPSHCQFPYHRCIPGKWHTTLALGDIGIAPLFSPGWQLLTSRRAIFFSFGSVIKFSSMMSRRCHTHGAMRLRVFNPNDGRQLFAPLVLSRLRHTTRGDRIGRPAVISWLHCPLPGPGDREDQRGEGGRRVAHPRAVPHRPGGQFPQ